MAAFGWLVWRLGQWVNLHWRHWRRPDAIDPVRLQAGRWLSRLREVAERRRQKVRAVPVAAEVLAGEAAVVAELQRLRYGPRDSWPEPRGVFKRARRVG